MRQRYCTLALARLILEPGIGTRDPVDLANPCQYQYQFIGLQTHARHLADPSCWDWAPGFSCGRGTDFSPLGIVYLVRTKSSGPVQPGPHGELAHLEERRHECLVPVRFVAFWGQTRC